ncbi:uncharacterized protein LOC121386395 [Gigantopelta aegis]|uniref:uncharacterized protein LOC121386395 n=1 Tax=Gigantopelta aegis TaxID=1735272 RepID=UPI001B88E076|nr:uncharacterized protein LOC121386395 [Gigantopelta aegis]
MPYSTIWLFILELFVLDVYVCGDGSVAVTPVLTGVVGKTSSIATLDCQYSPLMQSKVPPRGSSVPPRGSKRPISIAWLRKRSRDLNFEPLCQFSLGSARAECEKDSEQLSNRTRMYFNDDPPTFNLTLLSVRCTDEGEYKCTVHVSTDPNDSRPSSNVNFTVEAAPRKPVLSTTPNKDVFRQDDEVTFNCSGNVGRPAGWFWWFSVVDGVESNVTATATLGEPATVDDPAINCTFERSSTLRLTMTSSLRGAVIRCKTFHPTRVSEAELRGCSSTVCVESAPLNVTANDDTEVTEGHQRNESSVNVSHHQNNTDLKDHLSSYENTSSLSSRQVTISQSSSKIMSPDRRTSTMSSNQATTTLPSNKRTTVVPSLNQEINIAEQHDTSANNNTEVTEDHPQNESSRNVSHHQSRTDLKDHLSSYENTSSLSSRQVTISQFSSKTLSPHLRTSTLSSNQATTTLPSNKSTAVVFSLNQEVNIAEQRETSEDKTVTYWVLAAMAGFCIVCLIGATFGYRVMKRSKHKDEDASDMPYKIMKNEVYKMTENRKAAEIMWKTYNQRSVGNAANAVRKITD